MACFGNCWGCCRGICVFSLTTLIWRLRLTASRWRAAWFAFFSPRSRVSTFGAWRILRQCSNRRAAGWATANGACARKPHRPPRRAWWRTTEQPQRFLADCEQPGCSRHTKPTARQVVWVSGRRPHSRLPQRRIAFHGVDEGIVERQPIGARAWAGERIPGPPACPTKLNDRLDMQLIHQRKQGVIHHRPIRQPLGQTSKRRRGAPGTYSVACVVAQVAR